MRPCPNGCWWRFLFPPLTLNPSGMCGAAGPSSYQRNDLEYRRADDPEPDKCQTAEPAELMTENCFLQRLTEQERQIPGARAKLTCALNHRRTPSPLENLLIGLWSRFYSLASSLHPVVVTLARVTPKGIMCHVTGQDIFII